MAASVLVSGSALRPLLQLVDQTDGAAGEGLEAYGDHGKAAQTHHGSSLCTLPNMAGEK